MWKNEKEERRVEVSFVDDKRKAPSGQWRKILHLSLHKSAHQGVDIMTTS